MAHSTVTTKCFPVAVALLWIALFSRAESQGGVPSSPLPNDYFNCTPDIYVQLPYEVYYANVGDDLCVICSSNVLSEVRGEEAFIAFVDEVSKEPACSGVIGCAINGTEDTLCFSNIQENSFGDYLCRHFIDLTNPCEVPFTITEAVEPVYSLGPTGSEITLDHDERLILVPSITNTGLPPAEYVWEYSVDNTNFVTLSNQSSDTYVKNPVEASGRGYYRFFARNTANQASPTYLNYKVTVNFPPIITLITMPENANPMTTNQVTVSCSVISHPQIEDRSLELTYNGGMNAQGSSIMYMNIDEDISFSATISGVIPGCPLSTLTCSATNNVGFTGKSLDICNDVPVITNFMVDTSRSTNTTVRLVWTIENEEHGINGYLIQYRMSGITNFTTMHNNVKDQFYTIEGLQPRTLYEFRVSASNSAGDSGFTDSVNFTTFSEPTVQPYGVWVVRYLPTNEDENAIDIGWSEVPSTDLYTVTGYEVIFYNSVEPDTRSLKSTETLYFSLLANEVIVDLTYFFQVRAVGQYGAGPLSAVVESPPLDPFPNGFFNISITTLQLKDDQAYMAWSISGQPTPVGIFVNISQLDSDSGTLLSVGDFALDPDTREACFENLNITDSRYRLQFCVTASLPYGGMSHTCAFPTTAMDLPTSDVACISVTDAVSSLFLPVWAISSIAVSAGLLVLLLLCGCILCVVAQCRGTRVEIKEEEPYSSFSLDKDIHGGINGGFPSRPVSPPRGCMVYRRNQHHHQLDWKMDNMMEGPATIV